ncbi:MAG: hypothetical protein MUD14_26015 [Hydrococcus sp. Prado102]|jgi:hypothetical protein|nr:hypothetical protein [Hydrococcus sp. Prado102]
MSTSEPAVEYGTQLRNQYLNLARIVLNRPEIDYNSLYRQFASNQWACERLDREVAALALRMQHTPTQTAYLMAQSPYAQYEINEKGTAPEDLLPYAKSVVSYSLAQMRFAQSSQALWDKYSIGVEARTPAQLTQAVVKNALQDGQSREAIATMLEADPEYKRIEASLGEAKAKQYVRLALSAAVRLEKKERQQGLSQQHQQRPEMEL